MTSQDAIMFMRAITRKYPGIADKALELRAEWLEVFGRCERDDAYRALQEIYEGEHEKPFPDDWPAAISRLCRMYERGRYQQESKREQFGKYGEDERRAAVERMMATAKVAEIEPLWNQLNKYQQDNMAKELLGPAYDFRHIGFVYVTMLERYQEYLQRKQRKAERENWSEVEPF